MARDIQIIFIEPQVVKCCTSSIGPLAAQSRELPLPYSAPAKIIVSCPSLLYLCCNQTKVYSKETSTKQMPISRKLSSTHIKTLQGLNL